MGLVGVTPGRGCSSGEQQERPMEGGDVGQDGRGCFTYSMTGLGERRHRRLAEGSRVEKAEGIDTSLVTAQS